MCQAVRDYGDEREAIGKQEGKIETVKNMLEAGISFEKALEIAELDEKTYREYTEK